MLIPSLPSPLPVVWLRKCNIHAIGPVKVEDFDYTHTSIYIQETMRTGIGGPKSALTAGLSYGLPPILKFGSEELKQKFVPGILRGEVRVCIAITEVSAGYLRCWIPSFVVGCRLMRWCCFGSPTQAVMWRASRLQPRRQRMVRSTSSTGRRSG